MGDPAHSGWLVEQGIGEHRAIHLADGAVTAARIDWPGRLAAGEIADAVLVARSAGSRRGTLRFPCGELALVDGLPRDASEGSRLRAEVTRAALSETGRYKLAQARPTSRPARRVPSLARRLPNARVVRRFPDDPWPEIFAEAWSGDVRFPGGTLLVSPAPAMTLIDIDGPLAPVALAHAAVPPIARTLTRMDIAGSIGIDFPSLPDKADRRAIDTLLNTALANWPHEHTAMNGFGFVQVVSRLERASLLHRVHGDPAGAAARLLLRRAEHEAMPGVLLLTAHPEVLTRITDEWRAELARRTGRAVRLQPNAGLALDGGFAQAVPE